MKKRVTEIVSWIIWVLFLLCLVLVSKFIFDAVYNSELPMWVKWLILS